MLWLGQFKDSLIIILLVAMVLSAILGEVTEAIVIFVILLFATTPHYKLYENKDISLVVLNFVVPAYTHFVLLQVTIYRSHVLIQVNRAVIQTIEQVFRLLPVRSAYPIHKCVGEAKVCGQYEDLPLNPLDKLGISGR